MGHISRPQPRSGELPPPPIAWFHPLELLRTAYHAWLSQVATSFLDRREMLAALDREPPGLGHSDLDDSAQSEPLYSLDHHRKNGVWIDFAADLGDSWEATHAVATLMAQRELKVQGLEAPLPHADLVVLGGDLVYPSPTRDSYRRRTREPIGSALPQPDVPKRSGDVPRVRRLFSIPGNHDWYDGLTSFVREFCQGGQLGGWQLMQMRSYFSQKLMPGWWLWGIDIALDTRIDPAQQNFFLDILNSRDTKKHPRFVPRDNVILCTAKPSWLRTSRYSDDAYRNLAFFVRDLVEEHKGQVPIILAGDLHHYSRYQSDRNYQLITSGSAGSYLMSTHHLPTSVPPLLSAPPAPGTSPPPGYVHGGVPYPSQADSRRLALGALRMAFRRANIPFCLTIGVIYWWVMRMVDRLFGAGPITGMFDAPVTWHFVAVLTALVIVAGCAAFARGTNSRGPRFWTAAWGALHGLAHLGLAVLFARRLLPNPLAAFGGPVPPYFQMGAETAEMAVTIVVNFTVIVLITGWSGAMLVGVYLTLSDRLLRWHQNEIFAAQSIMDYRSFVRLHLKESGELRIYPIGLRRVPRVWRSRLESKGSDAHYEPTDGVLSPHLIEGPIVVDTKDGGWPAAQGPVPAKS